MGFFMLYSLLEDRKIGFPIRQKDWRTRQVVWREGQTPGNRGTQSQWVLTQSQESQVAEETYLEMRNPKDCAFGFFL
jgi:hypothetical protein